MHSDANTLSIVAPLRVPYRTAFAQGRCWKLIEIMSLPRPWTGPF
ncbi:hypothetical protein EV562_10179 [Streptomyces sp. BK208]|nr:hypothetical protein EV562_10179 [Streptomyces sp. BK208]